MKVLDLRCSRLHAFEGWFGSEDEFQDQSRRGLIACPLCADTAVQKMPSATRLNFGAHPPGASSAANATVAKAVETSAGIPPDHALQESVSPGATTTSIDTAAQAVLLAALRQVIARTEDLGTRFAEEARRMHYGEAEARSIRGQASVREAVDLLEEGIEILPLPMLAAFKETLQ